MRGKQLFFVFLPWEIGKHFASRREAINHIAWKSECAGWYGDPDWAYQRAVPSLAMLVEAKPRVIDVWEPKGKP